MEGPDGWKRNRWLSLFISQGYNLYNYVKGNPVNFNDPTGHWGGDFHFAMTAIAMLACGYSEDQAVSCAEANVAVDTNTATDPFVAFSVGDDQTMQKYHGFPAPGESRDDAIARNEFAFGLKPDTLLEYVGVDLHPLQDPYSHGGYQRGFHGVGADSTKRHYSEALAAFSATLRQVSILSSSNMTSERTGAAKVLIRLVAAGKVQLRRDKAGKLSVRLPWYRKKKGQEDLSQAQAALNSLLSREPAKTNVSP